MRLCVCGEEIDPRRSALGERRCLACGEAAAQREIVAKGKRVAPDYHKGGLVYQGAPEQVKQAVAAHGKKNATFVGEIPTGSYADRLRDERARPRPARRAVIGRYTHRGDVYTLFAGAAPPPGATQIVHFAPRKP